MFSSALLVYFFVLTYTHSLFIDLNGEWKFCSVDKNCYKGNVPGDVFTDLHNQGVIPHPLYGNNSEEMGWISRQQWAYSREFSLSDDQLQDTNPTLIFEGVDTVAKIYLNGKLLLNCDNQFRRYVVELKDILKNQNLLKVQFESPVIYAQYKSEKYQQRNSHEMPPVCPPTVYHGECHPNFIRKAQYSFSWDWGPAIPTVGIWKPVGLLLSKKPTPLQVSWITEKERGLWKVLGSLEYRNVPGSVNCSVEIETLGKTTFTITGKKEGKQKKIISTYDFFIEIPKEKVQLWWPAGEGTPKLYNLTVSWGNQPDEDNIIKEIGFRTVELVQDLVDRSLPAKGRNFYFKVNGRPVFLKGSNWIPASMFPGENTEKRVDFLLDSAVEANMNALRVWGGGVYESEYFYRLANKKGLLLWQDMMFACALYPTNKRFLNTVEEEITEQVFRLRKHPSILLFAGNNENEVAIRTHWWSVDNYTEQQQVEDYITIYAATIAPIVRYSDPSRPFLLSSPSNGQQTEEEGGVSKNPGDVRYGDIHFYNEFIDLWQDFNFLTPRCATEYGIQSMPFKETMTKWIDEEEWLYFSPSLVHRQHHPEGIITNPYVVFEHFPIGNKQKYHVLRSREYMNRYAYFSQAHQALTYKVQTEHYRRFRGKLTEDGMGNTMCALYWQLNDVWAAPTWSSIDFNLEWKMVHYEAKRFFAPLIVTLYSTQWDTIAGAVVNDGQLPIDAVTLTISQYAWGSRFDPVYKVDMVVDIPAARSFDINLDPRKLTDPDDDYVIAAELKDQNGTLLAPVTVLLPDKLYNANWGASGDVSIQNFTVKYPVHKEEDFQQIDSVSYSFVVVTDDISPLTWISLRGNFLFWFSDNGFTMVSPRKVILLHLRESRPVTVKMLSVCNLKTCGLQ